MYKKLIVFVAAAALALAGCSKSSTSETVGQQATVKLKDGSNFSGTVSKSDAASITLQGANGESRMYPMTQVDSVQYFTPDTTLPASAMGTSSTTTTTTTSTAGKMATTDSKPSPMAPMSGGARTIPAGTKLRIRNNEAISSSSANAGQAYSAVVAADVTDADGVILIPKGSNATLVVRSAEAQGKVEGRSELVLDMDSVEVAGRKYQLETADIVRVGKEGVGANKRTAKYTGGGAILGTIIGAVAGGGKGAAIGGLAGAGAGAATQSITRGPSVQVPAETVLTFQLEAPLRVRPM